MKELLTYIARSLVDDPDSVSVSQSETPAETVLELRVAPGCWYISTPGFRDICPIGLFVKV